jgi:hypothetical protein
MRGGRAIVPAIIRRRRWPRQLDAPGGRLLETAAHAQVAQLVEHVTENHGVGGSIPPLGTSINPASTDT